MLDFPQTLKAASEYWYGRWAGNPEGHKYDPSRCAAEVSNGHVFYQCLKKPGKGPGGLYCSIHAKLAVIPNE